MLTIRKSLSTNDDAVIYNGTSLEYQIYSPFDTVLDLSGKHILKQNNVIPELIIEPGKTLRYKSSGDTTQYIKGIPCISKEYSYVESPITAFPELKQEDFVIVTEDYAKAARANNINCKLLGLGGKVYTHPQKYVEVGYLFFIEF